MVGLRGLRLFEGLEAIVVSVLLGATDAWEGSWGPFLDAVFSGTLERVWWVDSDAVTGLDFGGTAEDTLLCRTRILNSSALNRVDSVLSSVLLL